jgi:hypothetical protein
MFVKLARFQGAAPRHAAQSQTAHCNDNHPVRCEAAVSRRAPRRVLVCGWHKVPATGRLECFWQIVPIDAVAAEEPVISRMIRQVRCLNGLGVAGAPPVPAVE